MENIALCAFWETGMLAKLEHYGVRGNAHKLLSLYLSSRI